MRTGGKKREKARAVLLTRGPGPAINQLPPPASHAVMRYASRPTSVSHTPLLSSYSWQEETKQLLSIYIAGKEERRE